MLSNKEVEKLLISVGAVLDGHFLLSSGKHAPRYVQCAKLLQHPELAKRVADLLARQMDQFEKSDAVIGPALGGIVIAYELARALGVRGMFSERDPEGRMTLRRGFEIAPGERILVVEDVVTTGGSSIEVARLVKEHGGIPVGIACIVDRRMEGAELPLPVIGAVRMQIPVYPPDNCPLCRRGIPYAKPGSKAKHLLAGKQQPGELG
ncbi:MAG: orotate phosphoribosyltransferase [Candidatus Bipolaricaulota bacterium]|nr:orotate phosphoribosyltransferase [Candidatus Bipolaricaulota bacterium]